MKKQPGARLAFRADDEGMWNCYLASMGHMDDALLIGSVLLRPIEENDAIKARFMACMKEVFAYTLKESLGIDIIEWVERKPTD